jgi:hypothetical protein
VDKKPRKRMKSVRPSQVGAEVFDLRRDASIGKIGVQGLEHLRSQFKIPTEDYVRYLRGLDNLDHALVKGLEAEYALMKEQQQPRKLTLNHGGVRARAGRKSEGVTTKLMRATGTPSEMKLVQRWIDQGPRASRRLVRLILSDMTSRFGLAQNESSRD